MFVIGPVGHVAAFRLELCFIYIFIVIIVLSSNPLLFNQQDRLGLLCL